MRRPKGTNATSKRGIERFARHGRTEHVRPTSTTKPGTARRRAAERRRIENRNGPLAGCAPGVVCWHRSPHYAWSQRRVA